MMIETSFHEILKQVQDDAFNILQRICLPAGRLPSSVFGPDSYRDYSSNFTNFSHRTAQQSYEITIKMAKLTYIHRDNNFMVILCGQKAITINT